MPPAARLRYEAPRMGTLVTITICSENSEAAQKAAEAAFHRISALEDIMSDYDADSELMRLCRSPAGMPVKVSSDLFEILRRAQQFSRQTDGAFDVTVGPFVRLWRFSRRNKTFPPRDELAAAAKAVGYRHVKLDSRQRTVTLTVPGMRLDLGGIGKGYAADQALLVLRKSGFPSSLVAMSGDLAIGDPPPGEPGWKVAAAPTGAQSDESGRMLILRNCGASTSGDVEQFVEIGGVRYSHIVNPATGLGLTNHVAATLIARDATTSDALTKGICISGSKKGLKLADSLPGGAALIVTLSDGKRTITESRRFKSLPRPP